jgi:glycosyltransferase involved in cell wall biosynthesis
VHPDPIRSGAGSADDIAEVLIVGNDDISGYAEAATRLVAALGDAGVDVAWLPLCWDADAPGGYRPRGHDEPGRHPRIEPLRRRERAQVVLAQTIPEMWPEIRRMFPDRPLVGGTVWETDRLPGHWAALFEVVDLIAVPGPFCRAVFEPANRDQPVEVLPHVAVLTGDDDPTENSPVVDQLDRLGDCFVFYLIESWTERKQLDRTIEAFLTAFDRDDPVALVVKTDARDLTDPHPRRGTPQGTAWWRTAELIKAHPRPPEVVLVTRRLGHSEIAALHRRGDCYFSLSHGEGWGLGPFDAASWGHPSIVSGWGGVRDYLDEWSAYFIDHELVPVEPPPGQRSYTADQRWSEPSFDHAVSLLREVASDPDAARQRGRRAQRNVQERFAPAAVAARCLDVLSLACRLHG